MSLYADLATRDFIGRCFRMKTSKVLQIVLFFFLILAMSHVCVAGLTGVSRIEITPSKQNKEGWLQVSEVVATETFTGNDLALSSAGANAFGSSNWPGSSPNFAIDGKAPDRFPNIFHSNENDRTSFLIIDLASPAELDSITLFGRTDCCRKRDHYNIRLFDAQGREIFSRDNLNATGRGKHRIDINLRNVINPFLSPGSFNAFESSTSPRSTTGRLFTKLAGVGFGVDIVVIGPRGQLNSFNDRVVVDLVANTMGGALDANNCPLVFSSIQTLTQNPTIKGGRSTVNFLAMNTAYRDVRVRVRFPVNAPTVTSCSADNFSIRPLGLTVSSTNATQAGKLGTPVIKTGANFNLIATAITGYDGTPSIDNAKIIGTPTAGFIGGNFNPAVNGVASGTGFFYSEVGNFGLHRNAIFDAGFTAVDQPNDCTMDFSNVMDGVGRYGCAFGSSAIPQVTGSSGFGRFIPDNFAVSFNAPQFTTACSVGTFTYVGRPFNYATEPIITVTARNGTNNGLTNATTRNYAGDYMKLANNHLTPTTQAERYLRFDALGSDTTPVLDTFGLPATTADPVIGSFADGVGTLTFSSGTMGLAFSRGSAVPSKPFSADIALAINVVDSDGVVFSNNPASFGAATAGNGIAFSNGNNIRFGRLRLHNALGSELLALQVPMTAEYWNGLSFVTNTLDNCTQIGIGNIGLANFTGNLSPGDTTVTTGAAFVTGVGKLTLSAPGNGNTGSVDLVANLGASATIMPCISLSSNPITTGANHSYLRSRWCGSGYDKDPVARVTFGVYKGASEMIYIREQYSF